MRNIAPCARWRHAYGTGRHLTRTGGPENEALRERLAALAETPNEAALGVVSSYAIDDGERLLLFDPLAMPSEIEELAAGREPVARLSLSGFDLSDAVTRMKQERSGEHLLAQGGVRFARSLVETGLIDEYRLVVHPAVLGAGERLFTAPLAIEPVSTPPSAAEPSLTSSRRSRDRA